MDLSLYNGFANIKELMDNTLIALQSALSVSKEIMNKSLISFF